MEERKINILRRIKRIIPSLTALLSVFLKAEKGGRKKNV